MFDDIHIDLVEKLTNVWAAKEALSKCLKTGINVDLKILKINKIEATEYQIRGDFLHFPQYNFLTFKQDNCIIAIAFPKNLEFQLDTANFTKIPFG
jgi:phosphopantetheinyl transferase (holo-ACP synthase)